jgi:hypothetical protein
VRIQGDIGVTLDFRVKLPGVSQEPDKLRIRLGIEPLFYQFNLDEFVKSRHSGENRSPDGPQLLENTGFRLSPE